MKIKYNDHEFGTVMAQVEEFEQMQLQLTEVCAPYYDDHAAARAYYYKSILEDSDLDLDDMDLDEIGMELDEFDEDDLSLDEIQYVDEIASTFNITSRTRH